MEVLADEKFLHDWVIRQIEQKYSREFNEISVNPGEEENFDYKGFFPDVIFGNYGQVVQLIEVETKSTANKDRIEYWKEISDLGVQLIVLVPVEVQNELRDLFWENGLAAKVKIGTYSVSIKI
ncbi:MAG: hypothetical protein GTO02_19540 [Candidatus Dadabacteria bacterium]|nr:hypothetical protein [Candidatus Dadabacteria bacterium]NIQ16502.1 hypothetical protein [Candidatus Dadabacteria bacterium]